MYLLKEEIMVNNYGIEFCYLDRKLGKDILDELKKSNNYYFFHGVLMVYHDGMMFLFVRRDIHFMFYEKTACEQFYFSNHSCPAWKNNHSCYFLHSKSLRTLSGNNHVFVGHVNNQVILRHRKRHNAEKHIQTNAIYAYYLGANNTFYYSTTSQFVSIEAPPMSINDCELVYFTTSEIFDSEISGHFGFPDTKTNISVFNESSLDESHYYYFIYQMENGYLVRVYDHKMMLIEEAEVDKYYSCKGCLTTSMLLVEKNDEMFLLPKHKSNGFLMKKTEKYYCNMITTFDDQFTMIDISEMNTKQMIDTQSPLIISPDRLFFLTSKNNFCFIDCSEALTKSYMDYFESHTINFTENPCHVFNKKVINIYRDILTGIYLVTDIGEIYLLEMSTCMVKLMKDRSLVTPIDIISYKNHLEYDIYGTAMIEKNCDIKTKILIIGSSMTTESSIVSVSNRDLNVLVSYGSGPSIELAHEILNYYQITFLDQTGHYPLFKENIDLPPMFLSYMGYTLLWCLFYVKKFPFYQPLRFYNSVSSMNSELFLSNHKKILYWKKQNPESFESYVNDPENYFDGQSFNDIFDDMFKLKANPELDTMLAIIGESFKRYTTSQFETLSTQIPILTLSQNDFMVQDEVDAKYHELTSLLIKKILTLDNDETSILIKNWTGYPYQIDGCVFKIAKSDKRTMFSTCATILNVTMNFLQDNTSWPILWIKDHTMFD